MCHANAHTHAQDDAPRAFAHGFRYDRRHVCIWLDCHRHVDKVPVPVWQRDAGMKLRKTRSSARWSTMAVAHETRASKSKAKGLRDNPRRPVGARPRCASLNGAARRPQTPRQPQSVRSVDGCPGAAVVCILINYTYEHAPPSPRDAKAVPRRNMRGGWRVTQCYKF